MPKFNPPVFPSLLSSKQVAERLGVSPLTVRLWAATGQLPSIRLGRKVWRIDEGALDVFVLKGERYAV